MEITYNRASKGIVQAVVYEQSGFGEADSVFGQCWMKKMRNGVSADSKVGMSRSFVGVRGTGHDFRDNSTGMKMLK